MHHTWRNGVLTEHPQEVTFRSEHLWRATDGMAQYCGGDRVISISAQSSTAEVFTNAPRLGCVHGKYPQLQVVGGDSGYILVNRGSGWKVVEDVPTLNHIVDVCCVSDTEVYLCAGNGGVFRWDGNSDWHHFDTDDDAFMYSLCRYQGRMCVASLNLKSYWLADYEAVPIPDSNVATRFKTDGDLLFGLGLGKFEVFDGASWRIHELDLYKLFPKELEAMHAAAPGP